MAQINNQIRHAMSHSGWFVPPVSQELKRGEMQREGTGQNKAKLRQNKALQGTGPVLRRLP